MIEKTNYNVTCDVKNCRHVANYIFPAKGRLGKFYICKECLAELSNQYNKLTIPKSPKNAIKKAMEEKNKTTIN